MPFFAAGQWGGGPDVPQRLVIIVPNTFAYLLRGIYFFACCSFVGGNLNLLNVAPAHSEDVADESNEIRLQIVQQDLSNCSSRLNEREVELMEKHCNLTSEVVRRKAVNDMAGAKRKLLERRRFSPACASLCYKVCCNYSLLFPPLQGL